MSKNKKQFGVWIDSENAVIAGRENVDNGDFVILAHAKSAGKEGNSNENAGNNAQQGKLVKLFKEITSHMQNVDEVHVTGTGDVQEQFIRYLSTTPQYKNTIAKESTSNKMSDESFIQFITTQFN
ncbi:MAG: hypothetical protein JWR18_2537 [Segetibacter sp.]|jgi:stalled ribosome rescue protein Dom34|nr:hypothetical protein [Segetibacter sp.]